jgi:hypothetical protein
MLKLATFSLFTRDHQKLQFTTSERSESNRSCVYSPNLVSNLYAIVIVKYNTGDQIKKKEGGESGSNRREERCILTFGGENISKETV